MRPLRFAPVFLLAAVSISPVPAAAAGLPLSVDGQQLPSLAPMVERASPAIVNINTSATVESPVMRDPFFGRLYQRPPRKVSSLGSGVIVDAQKGLLLTNHHVISGADEITVTLLDGRELKATLVGSDKETDIAVLRVPAERLTAVALADSAQLRVGDFVVAIGNPFGLGHSVTSGIVSALGRQGLGIEQYEDFIQTDAAINPGNSGGALVNLRGELVGINTAIVSPGGTGNVGIGFAIPINMARGIMQQLVQFGEVRRGLLGVSSQTLTPELADAISAPQTQGVVVKRVTENSPAAKAGLRAWDIITAINSKPVRSEAELNNQLGLLPAGSEVQLELWREGRKQQVRTRLASRSDGTPGRTLNALLDGLMLRAHGGEGESDGIEITQVEKGSRAAQAGLQKGDVIVALGRYRIRTLDELRDLAKGQRALPMNIVRDGSSYLLVLR